MFKKTYRRMFRTVCSLMICLSILLTSSFPVPLKSAAALDASIIGQITGELQGIFFWLNKDATGKSSVQTARTNLKNLSVDQIKDLLWPASGATNFPISATIAGRFGSPEAAETAISKLFKDALSVTLSTDFSQILGELTNLTEDQDTVSKFLPSISMSRLYAFFNYAQTEGIKNTAPQNWESTFTSGNHAQIRDLMSTWLSRALAYAVDYGGYGDVKTALQASGWDTGDIANAERIILQAGIDPGYQGQIALLKAYVRYGAHFSGTSSNPGGEEAISYAQGSNASGSLTVFSRSFSTPLQWECTNPGITVNYSNETNTYKVSGGSSGQSGEITLFYGNDSNWIYKANVSVTAGNANANANLSGLTVSTGTLDPVFTAATTGYTVNVDSSVSGITVTPTTADASATVKVKGTAVPSGTASANIPLSVGTQTITVTVTAQSGTVKNYILTVIRPQEIAPLIDNQSVSVNNTPVAITVPNGVSGAKIQATVSVDGANKKATLPLVEVQAVTALGTVTAQIPQGTVVRGPADWDGKITLPTVKANDSVSVSSGTVSAVVEVGLPDEILTFDKAVRLLVTGQAGKSAAYKRGNNQPVLITRTISADSQAVADSELPADQEGKIDVGLDLAIWTKHFTSFIAYTPSGGGGGGGGGAPAVPAISDADLDAAINAAGSGGKISIQASSDNKVSFTVAQLDKIVKTGKQVEVKASDVTFTLDAGALKAPDLNLSNVSVVQIGAAKLGSDAAKEIAGKAANGGLYNVAGDIFSLSALAAMIDKTQQDIKKFNGSVKVTLPVPQTARDAASKGSVSAGRFNEEASAWDIVSGSYDGTNGTYTFETDKFSKWALLSTKPLAFSDIAGHWAQKDIEFMAANGYVKGMGDGTFAPDAAITRAEFATLLVNELKLKDEGAITFLDVSKDAWYYSYVARASAAGLIKGYQDTQFGPEDNITREQMAVMIARTLQYKGNLKDVVDTGAVLGGFADKDLISNWAATQVAQIASQEIIKGRPGANGTLLFAPQANATRAEATVMLKRLLGLF